VCAKEQPWLGYLPEMKKGRFNCRQGGTWGAIDWGCLVEGRHVGVHWLVYDRVL